MVIGVFVSFVLSLYINYFKINNYNSFLSNQFYSPSVSEDQYSLVVPLRKGSSLSWRLLSLEENGEDFSDNGSKDSCYLEPFWDGFVVL